MIVPKSSSQVSAVVETTVASSVCVEQKSRADFAPDIKLPLSMLTATDNIMLGNHAWISRLEIKLSNAEQCSAMLSDT